MKAYLFITGQPQGNLKLLSLFDGEKIKLGNNWYIKYQTKYTAKKQLKEAFNRLKNTEREFYKEGGFSLSETTLYYDASRCDLNIGNPYN